MGSIHGLRTEHLRFTGQYQQPWEAASDSVPVGWDDYFMIVSFEKSYHAGAEGNGGAHLYALSCDENGYLGARVGVEALHLVALTDYNANYAQGDTLNGMVLVNDWASPPDAPSDFYPLSVYIGKTGNLFGNKPLD